MQKSTSGFTIVELIVIIVIIGIIAAIAIVSYGSYQTTVANDQRVTELRGWRATFEKYWAANGEYPYPSDGIYCLGTGFPNGRCAVFTSSPYTNASEAGSAGLMSDLAPYDPPPAGPREQVANTGTTPPYVEFWAGGYIYLRTILVFPGDDERECPEDMFRRTNGTQSSGGVTVRVITCELGLSNY